MKAVLRHLLLVAVLCLLAWPVQAADGILIVEKTTSGTMTQTSRVQIEPSRMRVDSTGGPNGPQAFVFDGAKQVMWIIDLTHKTYREITKADLDRLGQQMSGAMAQMQEQLKNLPPEQREKMQEMMKNMPGAAAPVAKTEYRKGGTATVGRWTCQTYEGYRGTEKVSELCTVPPAALGFSTADFDVSRQLAEFFRKIMPKDADRMFSVGGGEEGFAGVPVRSVYYAGGSQTVTELTDVGRQSFPASAFEVPAGFTKEASPFAPPR